MPRNSPSDKKIGMNVQMPADIHAKMTWLAKEHGRSLTKEIVESMKKWLEVYAVELERFH